ncbi:MAG: hypothetical protein ACRBCL_03290 [Maritimibacter sp.]
MNGDHRGGAAVAQLTEMPALESAAVLCLRIWCDSEAGQRREGFATSFAHLGGDIALEAVGHLCQLCLSYGRRPLMRHAVDCPCVGGDEACLAHMIAAATSGERDDAMMLACLMMRADFAPTAVHLAECAGVALARIAHARAHGVQAVH